MPRAVHNPDQGVQVVQSWGPEPVGANQVEALLAMRGLDLAGGSGPTPPGWGLSGSQEVTSQDVFASPQAFTGLAGVVGLSTFAPGAGVPIAYPADAHSAHVVLPGPGGT